MKSLSLILKLVALLAAAFCVYTWIDIRGKISDAETKMSQIPGATLADKATEAEAIRQNRDELAKAKAGLEDQQKEDKKTIEDCKSTITALQSERSDLEKSLKDEERKVSELKKDIKAEKAKNEAKDQKIAEIEGDLGQKDALIAKLQNDDKVQRLQEQINSLERKYEATVSELEKTKVKAARADKIQEIVYLENENGKTKKTTVYTFPYKANENSVATVIGFDKKNGVLAINKGKKDDENLRPLQVVQLKNPKNGIVFAEAQIRELLDDQTILALATSSVLPEYIAVKSQIELGAVETEKAAPVAPKKEEASEAVTE